MEHDIVCGHSRRPTTTLTESRAQIVRNAGSFAQAQPFLPCARLAEQPCHRITAQRSRQTQRLR